jgi:hypothetical protein
MKLELNKIYLSPLIIGPVFERGKVPALVYGETQVVALQYETDYNAAQALRNQRRTAGDFFWD